MVAIHKNEMLNIKARFETLYETQLNDIIIKEKKEYKLQDIILNIQYKDNNLFLAIEQGSGKYNRHTNVVLNPKVKNKARQWLVEEYPALIFKIENRNEMSVNITEFRNKAKYNNDLKEFLTPRLLNPEAKVYKKFRKRMKFYA